MFHKIDEKLAKILGVDIGFCKPICSMDIYH
jgi:hypothetical protein